VENIFSTPLIFAATCRHIRAPDINRPQSKRFH